MRYDLYPDAGAYLAWGLLLLRLVAASVFFASGLGHVKAPQERAKSLGLPVAFTLFLGWAEVLGALGLAFGALTQWAALGLILIMMGAIFMKATRWKTGFWGEKNSGWHYDLLFVAMCVVIFLSDGGRFTLMRLVLR
jgi:putative oxidoreductase